MTQAIFCTLCAIPDPSRLFRCNQHPACDPCFIYNPDCPICVPIGSAFSVINQSGASLAAGASGSLACSVTSEAPASSGPQTPRLSFTSFPSQQDLGNPDEWPSHLMGPPQQILFSHPSRTTEEFNPSDDALQSQSGATPSPPIAVHQISLPPIGQLAAPSYSACFQHSKLSKVKQCSGCQETKILKRWHYNINGEPLCHACILQEKTQMCTGCNKIKTSKQWVTGVCSACYFRNRNNAKAKQK